MSQISITLGNESESMAYRARQSIRWRTLRRFPCGRFQAIIPGLIPDRAARIAIAGPGWLLGGPGAANHTAMALSTGVRNVRVSTWSRIIFAS